MSETSVKLEGSKHDVCSLLDRISDLEDLVYGAGRRGGDSRNGSGKTSDTFFAPVAIANPAPLGLLGFGIVSFLSGVLKISSDESARTDGIFAGTAIFVGGFAQLVAGLMQFVKNETHSATIFSLYGLHWISQGFIIGVRSLQELSFSARGTAAMAAYYALMTFATIALWLPTFRMNRVLNLTLSFVIVVFFLDAVSAGGWRGVEVAAGIASCTAASLGFYLALLDLVNEAWKKPLLPLFPHREHKADYDDSMGRPWVPKRIYHKSSVSSAHI